MSLREVPSTRDDEAIPSKTTGLNDSTDYMTILLLHNSFSLPRLRSKYHSGVNPPNKQLSGFEHASLSASGSLCTEHQKHFQRQMLCLFFNHHDGETFVKVRPSVKKEELKNFLDRVSASTQSSVQEVVDILVEQYLNLLQDSGPAICNDFFPQK